MGRRARGYKSEKRKKELKRQKKQEEKRLKRQNKSEDVSIESEENLTYSEPEQTDGEDQLNP